MKILLLNGPPGAGKDTIATIMKKAAASNVKCEKFAQPMKTALPLIYGIPVTDWQERLDLMPYKDEPAPELFGKTPREVQIALSETLLKPLHDKFIFGKLLLNRIKNLPQPAPSLIVVSDSGFREEAEIIVNEFGAKNVFLWRIHRQGCDFKKDSRDFITLKDLGVAQFEVDNNESIELLRYRVTGAMHKAFMSGREWIPLNDKDNRLENDDDLHKRIVGVIDSWLNAIQPVQDNAKNNA